MGLLDKFKKKVKSLQQDTSQRADDSGIIFTARLLMDEMCKMPDKEYMHEIMNKHLGETESFCYEGKAAGFAPKKYLARFEKGKKQVLRRSHRRQYK